MFKFFDSIGKLMIKRIPINERNLRLNSTVFFCFFYEKVSYRKAGNWEISKTPKN